jgi:hypothetical protein
MQRVSMSMARLEQLLAENDADLLVARSRNLVRWVDALEKRGESLRNLWGRLRAQSRPWSEG